MQLMTDTSVVMRNSEVLDVQRDEQKLLFHPTAGLYCDLDKVGTRVWNLLETPQSIGSLITTLTARYQVSPDTCKTETQQFLYKLRDSGFLSIEPPERA